VASTSAEIVDRLRPVERPARDGLAASIGSEGDHAAAMAAVPALHQIEVGGTAEGSRGRDRFTIVAWNVERGTHLDAAIDVLRRHDPDVVLATELDVGMARSANRHTIGEIAASLGHSYAFGVEFVELGLGDAGEASRLGADASNEDGFHGNGITTRTPLADHLLIRIEDDGSWFTTETDQPRVGGRMALAGRLHLAGHPVAVCAVHLESESDPALRTRQLEAVLQAIDAHYGTVACVVGGDLNTFSASQAEVRARFRDLRDEDPTRFCWPVPYEPLFEIAARHGFDVEAANPPEQTMRLAADQRAGSLLRLDWLLVRGLEVTARWTIPAVDPEGAVISDHDAVAAAFHHPR
jgi:endonuclease/exonuclease/phosphatase family metal-dependent hydrolase